MANNINWKQAQNEWRFGTGEILLRGEKNTQYYIFRWFESTEEFTVYWTGVEALEAQKFLKTAKVD